MDSDGARSVHHRPMIVETPKADNNSVSVGSSTMDVRSRPRDGADSGYCFSSSSSHHPSVSPDAADDRKRPLSIASNSSSASSSSSLPRHVRKRIANASSSSSAATGCSSSSADSGVSNASCEMLSTVAECGSPVDSHRPSSSGGAGVFEQAFDNALRGDRSAEVVPLLSSPCRYDSSVADDYLGNSDVEESAGSSERNSCDCLNGSESKLLTGVAYIERVVAEILETERSYVKDLSDLVQGYTYQLKNDINLEVSRNDIDTLFGNIETIWKFNRHFLSRLEQCGQDPVKIAACFVSEICGFEIYSTYCTNYPRSVETLMKMMKDEKVANILKKQQMSLQHSLPLGSYLLKPVQRILKYHILLQNIFNNHDTSDEGHSIIEEALDSMMSVAQNINEMKRQHEHAVRLQEIQCHLGDWDGTDLMTLGGLIREERFRVCGAKALRRLFLFEKAILLTKEREDGVLLVKSYILFSNLMVIESVPKEPLSFQLIPYDAPREQITLQASSLEQKRSWCQWIKRLMLENYGPKIPDKAKELVMKLGKSKEEEDFESSNMETPEQVKKQHNAPAYLEKRKGRRKSTGFIHDLKLKPRKGLRSRLSSSDASKPQMDGSHSHGRNSIDVLPVTDDDEESVSCGDDCEKVPSDRGSSGSCSYARETSASDLYKRDGSFSSQSSYSPATTPVGKTRGNIKSSFAECSGPVNGESSAVAGSGLESSCEKQSQSSSSLGKLPEEFAGRRGASFHRSSSAGGELHRVIRNASWADSDAVDAEGETIASGNYQIKWYRSLRKPGSGCHATSRDSASGSIGSRLAEETPIAASEAANDGDIASKKTVTSSYSCTTLPSQESIASNCDKNSHAPKISDSSPKTLDLSLGVKNSRSLVSDLAKEVTAGTQNDLEGERNGEGERIGSAHGTSTRPSARIPAESYQDFCSHTTIHTRVSGSGSSSEKVETLSIKSEDRKETRTRLTTLLGRSASGREQKFRFPSEGCSQTGASLGEFLKDRRSLIRECMATSPSQMFDSLFTMTNRTAHHHMPLSACRQTLNRVQTDSNGLGQPTSKTSPTQQYEVKIVKLQPESDTVFVDVDPVAGKLFSQNSGIEGNDAEFYYENKLLEDLEDGCKTDDDDDDDGGSLTVKSDDVPHPSTDSTELSSRTTKGEPSNSTERRSTAHPAHTVEVKLSKKAQGIQEILHTLENVARNGHSGSSTYYSRVVHRTVRDRSRDQAIRASVTRVRHNDSNVISIKSEMADEDYLSRSNNIRSDNATLNESLQTESRTTRL